MAQSLCNVLVHVIFSTRSRIHYIKPAIRKDLHAYLAGIVRTMKCECYRVGGVEDHVHLAVRLHSTVTVAQLIEKLKSNSSKWAKDKGPGLELFSWQNGYGAFSISPHYKDQLVSYIENQEEHHQAVTFQEEFRGFLRKYNVPYDEKYVWD